MLRNFEALGYSLSEDVIRVLLEYSEKELENLYFELSDHADKLAMKLKAVLTELGYSFLYQSYTNQQFPIMSNEELAEIGVSEMLLDKIRLLAKTFPDDVPEDAPQYCDYIWALLADPICRKVKYADLLVNNSYEDSPVRDGRRFTGQYPQAMALLANAVEGKLYFNSRTPYFDIFSNFHGLNTDPDVIYYIR